ncbi:MAG: T9SS type A sorting domain-containing protein [bacterium]|nr:T9SS type A sorting domain-containing protein [bacterium]
MSNRTYSACLALLTVWLVTAAAPSPALSLTNLFVLHHSVGRNILEEGNVRQLLDDHNVQRGTRLVLWDHDYNAIGLMDPDGDLADRYYDIPDDDTYVVGLHQLWTTANSARDSILANHQVIAFKSCYGASLIETDAMLAQYKAWYLEIRDVLDQHPDHVFLLMSSPPMHPCLSTSTEADRGRAFADWLGSTAFLGGHPNLRFFDLFDVLASPRDAEDRNTLRANYCKSTSCSSPDSHPNAAANLVAGPLLVAALVAAAGEDAVDAPAAAATAFFTDVHPNPFNPTTTIRFALPAAGSARLAVYDVTGRLVRTLIDGNLAAGAHEASWDGRDAAGRSAASGVYLARLSTASGAGVVRVTLAK